MSSAVRPAIGLAIVSAFETTEVASGPVTSATVDSGGSYDFIPDGFAAATQSSTDGSGTGAEFTVLIVGATVTGISSVDVGGSGYIVGDLITLSISLGITYTAAVLEVSAIG